jgi:hypothetical protein
MSARGTSSDRITLNVSPEQQQWLNDTARHRSTSVSEVLRRLIDETRGAYLTPAAARRSSPPSPPPTNITEPPHSP